MLLTLALLSAFAAPLASNAAGADGQRLSGSDRYATAASVSRHQFAGPVATAFVATGESFPDALAATPAAARGKGPILLTAQGWLAGATAVELARLKPARIVVLGGPSAVSDSVVSQLHRYSSNVVRWSGADRHATAATISARTFAPGVGVAYVATGGSFPDALAGGAIAARNNGPILLVSRTGIPSATAAELQRLRPAKIVVLGGAAAVSEPIRNALTNYTGGAVSRIAGADRYATSVQLSRSTYGSSDSVVIVTGRSFPDGLAGGPLAALLPGPLLLVAPTSLPASVAAELKRLAPKRVLIVGGTAAVSAGVEKSIQQAIGTRVAVASAGRILISSAELMALPTSGAAWDALVRASDQLGSVNLADQDDHNDVRLLARALVTVRTGGDVRAIHDALGRIPGTEGSSTLALGRNLAPVVLAADLVGYRDPAFATWLRGVVRTNLDGRTLISTHEDRPNNWGTHAGASRIAAALYLGDTADLGRAAAVFRGWLGERSVYAGFNYGELDWQANASAPVGVNPRGATKNGRNIDGVLPDDQRRGGGFTWPPPKENYVYGALQGALLQAELLTRAGYPAYGWGDQALARAYAWLHNVAAYPAEGDDTWQMHLVNYRYGTSYPAPNPSRHGKSFGFTDWLYRR